MKDEYTVRIIVIGDDSVGKTSLIKRFTTDTFDESSHIATIGTNSLVKTIETENETIHIQLMDTQGQERFRTLTSSFYQNQDIVVMAHDVTDGRSTSNLRFWHDDSIRFVPTGAPHIVVGTKMDLCTKEEEHFINEGRKFAEEHQFPYMETSAKTNLNVDKLFESIAKEFVQQKRQERALCKAAAASDIPTIEYLLAKGVTINAFDASYNTPLHNAAKHGHTEAVKFLLGRGADINISNQNGHKPLEMAVQSNNIASVDILMGATKQHNPNWDINRVELLSHAASFSLSEEMVKYLVAQGSAIDQQDSKGLSPLAHAVLDGQIDTVKTLLAYGADIDTQDKEGSTLLMHAIKENQPEIFDLLLSQPDVDINLYDKDEWNALHFAVNAAVTQSNMQWAVIKLVERGINVNQQATDGNAPLHTAIECMAEKETVDALLSHPNIDLDIVDDKEKTPLHHAVVMRNQPITNALIAKGADVNLQDEKQKTPLHYALEKRNAAAIRSLCNCPDIELEHTDHKGKTPLYLAFNYKNAEAVDLLLAKGADVNNGGIDDKYPLIAAIQSQNRELIDTLLSRSDINVNVHDGNYRTPLYYAVRSWDKETIKKLLEKDASLSRPVSDSTPYLLYAYAQNDRDMINLLLDHDEELGLHARDTWDGGITLLHIAAFAGNVTAIKTLLENGADINAQDGEKRTPLHVAFSKKQPEATRALFEYSGHVPSSQIHVKQKDWDGIYPIHIAAATGNLRAVMDIIKKERPLAKAQPKKYAQRYLEAAMLAHNENKSATATFLLDYNACATQLVGNPSITALLIAASIGDAELCKHVYEKDTKQLNKRAGPDKITPLYIAINQNRPEVTSYLLSLKETDVNIADKNGITPLHIAAQQGDIELFQALIANGANINKKDTLSKTPLHYAIENEHWDLVNTMIENPKTKIYKEDEGGNSPLSLAVEKGIVAVTQKLIAKGAEKVDYYADTPLLYLAATSGNPAMVDYILETVDVDINETGKKWHTALHVAAESGNLAIVKRLLAAEEKPDVNVDDYDENMPLHLALMNGHNDIALELLKDKDISLESKNDQNMDAIKLAAMYGNREVFQTILAIQQERYAGELNGKPYFQDNSVHPKVMKSILKGSNLDVFSYLIESEPGFKELFQAGYSRVLNNVSALGNLAARDQELGRQLKESLPERNTPFQNCMILQRYIDNHPAIKQEIKKSLEQEAPDELASPLAYLHAHNTHPDPKFVAFLKEECHCSLYPNKGIKPFYKTYIQHHLDDISELRRPDATKLYQHMLKGEWEEAKNMAEKHGKTEAMNGLAVFLLEADFYKHSGGLDLSDFSYTSDSSDEEHSSAYDNSYSSDEMSSEADFSSSDEETDRSGDFSLSSDSHPAPDTYLREMDGRNISHMYSAAANLSKIFFGDEDNLPQGIMAGGMTEFIEEEITLLRERDQKSKGKHKAGSSSQKEQKHDTIHYDLTLEDRKNIERIMKENSAGGFATDQAYTVLYKHFRHNPDVNLYHVGGVSYEDNTWDLKAQLEKQGINESTVRYEAFILPITQYGTGHATAVVIDREKKSISYIDPMISTMPEKDRKSLQALFPEFTIRELTEKKYRQQHNDWECTLHSITNVLDIVKGKLNLHALDPVDPKAFEETAKELILSNPEDYGITEKTSQAEIAHKIEQTQKALYESHMELQQRAVGNFADATKRNAPGLLLEYYQDEKTQHKRNAAYRDQIFALRIAVKTFANEHDAPEIKQDITEISQALLEATKGAQSSLSFQYPSPREAIDSVLEKNPDNMLANKLSTLLYWPESSLSQTLHAKGTAHIKGMKIARQLQEEQVTVGIVIHEDTEWSKNLMLSYRQLGANVIPITQQHYQAAHDPSAFLDKALANVQLVAMPGSNNDNDEQKYEQFYEHVITKAASMGMPMHGECYGFQRITKHMGDATKTADKTYNEVTPKLPQHAVTHHEYGSRHGQLDVVPGSYLAHVAGKTALSTDSSHYLHINPNVLSSSMKVEATVTTTDQNTHHSYTVTEAIASQATIPSGLTIGQPQIRATQFHSSYDMMHPKEAPDLAIHERLLNERQESARHYGQFAPTKEALQRAITKELKAFFEKKAAQEQSSPSFAADIGSKRSEPISTTTKKEKQDWSTRTTTIRSSDANSSKGTPPSDERRLF